MQHKICRNIFVEKNL